MLLMLSTVSRIMLMSSKKCGDGGGESVGDGGTSCENHADVLQESLVLYLEVGEQEDNLIIRTMTRTMKKKLKDCEDENVFIKELQEEDVDENVFSDLFPICS